VLRALIVLGFGAIGAVLSCGESITGVVYSNKIGNGIHPAGKVELAAGKRVSILEYGEPLETHFSSESCNDLGALWTVTVQHIDNNLFISSVTCTGGLDQAVHTPWLLVRDYLNSLPSSVSRADSLSSRYRSSPEFRRFVEQVNSLDLNFYFGRDELSRCLKIVSVESSNRTSVAADCAVELRRKLVGLRFDVVRDKANGKWEIDGIKID
jgi:hypothetical protein